MNSSNGGVHHPQCTPKSKQQGPWPHEFSWVQPPVLLGAASCSRCCYSSILITYNPSFQTCCTVHVLFHQLHILGVHFTRRVSELFDISNLLQHVGTSNSFNFRFEQQIKLGWGSQEQNMEGLLFSYILLLKACTSCACFITIQISP